MNSRSLRLVLIALLSVSLPVHACINESGTNSRGERIELSSHAGQNLKPHLVTATSKTWLIEWSRHTIDAARKDASFNNLNNLAAVLIRHGRLPEAVALLQFLERKYPGRYETASNVGTAYELMGRNEDALKWIQVGLERNPADHQGTEWLHVHILKAKLGRVAAPAPGRSILDLDFGNGATPSRPPRLPAGNAGKPLSLYELGQALRYQLLERIAFVAAPDPMVAGLLLDWANLELLAGTVESADVLYDAARRYGSKDATIAVRKTQVAKILTRAKARLWQGQGNCELCEPE
ncbi:MAG: tetratricopeptide repeat protein [Pseudomonadota bacterium]